MLVGCVVAPGLALPTSCGGAPEPECTTAIDCDIDQACREGRCIAADEGDEGEGEGDGGGSASEAATFAAACERLAACGAVDGADTCVQDAVNQMALLRASGDPDCDLAAAAFVEVYACVLGETCEVLGDTGPGGLFEAACPGLRAANDVMSRCTTAVGEGEGEGEGEGGLQCLGLAAFPSPAAAELFVFDVRATRDAVAHPSCDPASSAFVTVFADGDLTTVTDVLASFEGTDVKALLDVRVDPAGQTVTGVLCFGANAPASFAVALFARGAASNAVCGFIEG